MGRILLCVLLCLGLVGCQGIDKGKLSIENYDEDGWVIKINGENITYSGYRVMFDEKEIIKLAKLVLSI